MEYQIHLAPSQIDAFYPITLEIDMSDATVLSITEASQTLSDLVEQVNQSHEPMTIASAQGNAVLVSEQAWNALQETLYLKSIPGFWDSIEVGIHTPLEDCTDDLAWVNE